MRRFGWKGLTVTALALVTLSLHYTLLPFPHWVHLIHRRLCYVPIIMGGLWFGLPGGLIVAGLISLAILPLALHGGGPFWANEDMVEIVFYIALGTLTGFLVDKGAAEHAHAESLRHQLSESERLASLGRMASGVAHEVRTPLGSIQGVAEILSEDFPPDHPKRPFFEILLQEIARLKMVVQEFLDLGRPIAVESLRLDVRGIVDECCRSLQPPAERKGISFEMDVRGDCQVWGDSLRLHQALTNLVRNAIEASPRGASVIVGSAPDAGGCRLWVEDGGPGLPPGDVSRLFEPFFTTRKDGSGIGLALVRQIAEAHGGWVRGESKPEGGARFSLWLPCEGFAGPVKMPGAAAGGEGR